MCKAYAFQPFYGHSTSACTGAAGSWVARADFVVKHNSHNSIARENPCMHAAGSKIHLVLLCLACYVQVVRELSRDSKLRTAVLVGGDAMEAQFAELAQNPDIIVATPGVTGCDMAVVILW